VPLVLLISNDNQMAIKECEFKTANDIIVKFAEYATNIVKRTLCASLGTYYFNI
jgi:hypothetical protein